MRTLEYIRNLAANGIHHFSTSEAAEALGVTRTAVRARLRRLKRQGLIAEPVRGFHLIIPPEYARLGCLPAEQFIDPLMRGGATPYYIGLLSAAERFGAAHQRPQATQVMVPTGRKPVQCGAVRIVFIARADVQRMPITQLRTPRGFARYSTPELTALELVGYPNQAGGINNVATVLSELAEELEPRRLSDTAKLCPVGWSQRLGYLLELLGHAPTAASLFPFVQSHATSYIPLRRSADLRGARWVRNWKVIVNVEVEPDQ